MGEVTGAWSWSIFSNLSSSHSRGLFKIDHLEISDLLDMRGRKIEDDSGFYLECVGLLSKLGHTGKGAEFWEKVCSVSDLLNLRYLRNPSPDFQRHLTYVFAG